MDKKYKNKKNVNHIKIYKSLYFIFYNKTKINVN